MEKVLTHPRLNQEPGKKYGEELKQVQQQLSYGGFTKVFDAAIQPSLEGVRVIGARGCNRFCQYE